MQNCLKPSTLIRTVVSEQAGYLLTNSYSLLPDNISCSNRLAFFLDAYGNAVF